MMPVKSEYNLDDIVASSNNSGFLTHHQAASQDGSVISRPCLNSSVGRDRQSYVPANAQQTDVSRNNRCLQHAACQTYPQHPPRQPSVGRVQHPNNVHPSFVQRPSMWNCRPNTDQQYQKGTRSRPTHPQYPHLQRVGSATNLIGGGHSSLHQNQPPSGTQNLVAANASILSQQNMMSHSTQPLHQYSVNGLQQAHNMVNKRLQPIGASQTDCTSFQSSRVARLQASTGCSFQSKNVTDRPNELLQKQTGLPEALSGSRAQADNADADNWHEQTYQELRAMKENHLPKLIHIYRVALAKISKPLDQKQFEKFQNIKKILETLIKLLQSPRTLVPRISKENLDSYKELIILFVNKAQRKDATSGKQPDQQLQLPGSQSHLPQPQQQGGRKLQLNPPNIVLTHTPSGSICLTSKEQGVLNSQPDVLGSFQTSFQKVPEQGNACSPLQHGMRSSVQHDSINSFGTGVSTPSQHLQKQQKHQAIDEVKQSPPVTKVQQRKQKRVEEKMTDVNDSNVTQVNSGMCMRNHKNGQETGFRNHVLFPKTSYQLHTSQISQHSSTQIDQKNPLPPSDFRRPSQSTVSPFDFENQSSCDAHAQTPGAVGQIQNITAGQNKSLATVAPGITASPSITEFKTADCNQQKQATESSFERLLKTVKSISPKALRAAVGDLGAAVNPIDKNAGTTDMKRKISALSTCCGENDSFGHMGDQTFDIESTERSWIKKSRIEPKNALLEEITCMNQRFIETSIDVIPNPTENSTTSAGEGTVIRCSYKAMSSDENIKHLSITSRMQGHLPILPLLLLVPVNYPNSSPLILDSSPVDRSKEHDDLLEKAKSRLSTTLHGRSQPLSVGEVAKAWDASARKVVVEYTQLMGGECFSSRYGKWQNCITAR